MQGCLGGIQYGEGIISNDFIKGDTLYQLAKQWKKDSYEKITVVLSSVLSRTHLDHPEPEDLLACHWVTMTFSLRQRLETIGGRHLPGTARNPKGRNQGDTETVQRKIRQKLWMDGYIIYVHTHTHTYIYILYYIYIYIYII